MPGMNDVPGRLLKEVAHLRLPTQADERLQRLMDLNTNGALTASEQKELNSLVDWSESVSLLKGQALTVLGERPQ